MLEMKVLFLRSLLYACVGILLAGAVVRADPDDEDADPDVQPARPQAAQIVINDQVLDGWIYQGSGNRPQFDQLLAVKIDWLKATCQLTDAQRGTLELAAHGDIRRFQDQVDAIRQERDKGPHDQNEVNRLFQLVQPLRLRFQAGVFSKGSLFSKTVARVFTADQVARYAAAEQERRKFRYQALVELVVMGLDRNLVFDSEQRTRFTQLIFDETAAPRRFGGDYDMYYLLYALSQIPQQKIEPLFDEAQWKALAHMRSQYRGYQQFLTQQGYIEAPPANPPAAAGGAAQPAANDAAAKNAKEQQP